MTPEEYTLTDLAKRLLTKDQFNEYLERAQALKYTQIKTRTLEEKLAYFIVECTVKQELEKIKPKKRNKNAV